MNIEEIKTEWAGFSQKLSSTQRLSEQLILSMLRERSMSRVAKIRRNNTLYLVLMFANLVLLAAIFAGNPFDFRYTIQFIPYGILAIGILLAIISLVKSLQSINVNINNASLGSFLKRAIEAYEKNKKIHQWFGIFIFSAGTLTALSFLPKKLEHKEIWQAVAETALSMIITLAIYFIAYKAGAFRNRHKEDFENDLKEWNELRSISSELENE